MIYTNTRTIIGTTAIAAAAFLSGCVVVTKFKDEKRTEVSFSNARAAQVFYSAALLPHGPSKNGHGRLEVFIALPVQVKKEETQNIAFNKAVRQADINRDEIITESEANNFAKNIK